MVLPHGRTCPGVDHQLELESSAAVNLGIGGCLQGLQIFLFFLENGILLESQIVKKCPSHPL